MFDYPLLGIGYGKPDDAAAPCDILLLTGMQLAFVYRVSGSGFLL